MKKILVSIIFTYIFAVNSAFAGENGGFLGIDLGGGIGLNLSVGNFAPTGVPGVTQGGQISTLIAMGLKGGYQAFFVSKKHGVRFYLSGMAGLNATGNVSGPGVDVFVLADIDADYLVDFVDNGNYTFGAYMGIFTGALIGIPVVSVVQTVETSIGVVAGLNLGIRTVVNKRGEFDFGVKVAANFNSQGTGNRVIGLFLFIGSGYSYRF